MGYPDEAAAIAAAIAAGLRDEVVDGVTLIGPAAHVRQRLEEDAGVSVDVAALNILAADGPAIAGALELLAPAHSP